jgi:8-amino-3,8-dideoxy-alpha-D-manno-octulosonate transaminase
MNFPPCLHGVTEIGDAEIAAVTAALQRKTLWRFLNSDEVSESAQLEKAYREMCGVRHALAIGGGGTGALICALVGLGLGSGDEVLVPGYTYIATAAACLSVGALPVLVEIDESLTLDPRDLEAKITPFTRAIIPVHIAGTPCDMEPILAIARRHHLKVLEDCAQANGATDRGRPVGSIGDAGAFSLQHYKLITAGEGGIVTTNDTTVYQRAAVKHDSALQFWRDTGDWETFAGENYRMSELHAALGLAQFQRLPGILARCRAVKRALHDRTPFLDRQPWREGDCGINFAFYLPTAAAARQFSDALTAAGLPNATIYNKQIPDRHIYTAWDYVLEKRTSDHTGWPWTAAHRPLEYRPDLLPRTLDILGRCIAIGLSQHWTDAHIARAVAILTAVHQQRGRS